jgi:hypothetical protein
MPARNFMEAAMSYLSDWIEAAGEKFDIERKRNGWVVVDREAEVDCEPKPYSRILSFEAAQRLQYKRRVRYALFCYGMKAEEAERIARRQSKARRRRDWRSVVRQHFHWSYHHEWGVRPASDAQQKSNVIMYRTPPSV